MMLVHCLPSVVTVLGGRPLWTKTEVWKFFTQF
jgi:hypothetical protein